jgi:hypothetical protein
MILLFVFPCLAEMTSTHPVIVEIWGGGGVSHEIFAQLALSHDPFK